jgi:hypothetical protein
MGRGIAGRTGGGADLPRARRPRYGSAKATRSGGHRALPRVIRLRSVRRRGLGAVDIADGLWIVSEGWLETGQYQIITIGRKPTVADSMEPGDPSMSRALDLAFSVKSTTRP